MKYSPVALVRKMKRKERQEDGVQISKGSKTAKAYKSFEQLNSSERLRKINSKSPLNQKVAQTFNNSGSNSMTHSTSQFIPGTH